MGLILAATTSIADVVGDQFKEVVTPGSQELNVLLQRGVVNHGSGNLRYTEGVISNGSTIIVPEGMAMMMIENGAIREFCAEPGTYKFDQSSQPSVFEGGFFKGIGDAIKEIGTRITYGGQPANGQRVYYINTKTILDNRFGSQQPEVVADPKYGSVEITYNGEYSFRVVDPTILIGTVLGGNAPDVVTVEEIVGGQLRSQFSQNVSVCIAKLMFEKNISFDQIQIYKNEVTDQMNTLLDASWKQKYGLIIEDVALRINASEESKELIRNASQRVANVQGDIAFANAFAQNQAGMMASIMNNAANNTNGAVNAFVGMNATAGAAQTFGVAPQQAPAPQAAPAPVEAAPVAEEAPVAETTTTEE